MKLKKTFKSQDGISFIEALLYVAIVSMVMGAFFSFSLSNNIAYTKTIVTEDVHANLRYVLDIMSQRIRTAIGVNAGASLFETDPGVLSLAMYDPLYDPVVFNLDQDDGTLYITEGLGFPTVLTTEDIYISNLIFKHFEERGQEAIIIEITAERRGDSQEYRYTQSARTAVSLR